MLTLSRILRYSMFLAWSVSPAVGDQVTVSALSDNTIFSESAELSNGAGQYFFAGRTQESSEPTLRRGLIRFDLAGAVPAGSTIDGVTLRLYMSRSRANGEPVSVHLTLSDWGEGASAAGGEEGTGTSAEQDDATWLYTFYDENSPETSPLWSAPGGDFDGVASATTVVGAEGVYYEWSSMTMQADVEFWIANPGMNFGWVLVGNEGSRRTAARFNSRTNTSVGTRPELVIDFTPPATTGACELPGGGCVIDTAANCVGAGGTYLGDGTVCPDPTGACCLPSGQCVTDTAGNCAAIGGIYQGDGVDCADVECPVVLTPYVDPLTTPPVAVPTVGTPGGEATYDISMVQTTGQLHSELPPTVLWTYNGSYPGPTIVASTGSPVTVNWINDLRDGTGALRTDHILPVDPCPHGAVNQAKTVVHLHGGHVPAEVDGHPEATFLPGESATYVYPMNQRAGLSWYHDHALGITRLNVYMGLAGGFLIRDSEEGALDLPVGEFEIPLVIQDRSFNPDGSLKYPASWSQQFFGDYNLVNGTVTPFLSVKRAKYRFRVINGCNSRTYTLALSNGMSFDLIGVEGGLLEAPVSLTEMTLGSAERADILVDFSQMAPGTEIELRNSAPAPFPGDPGVGVVPEVMKFVVSSETGPSPDTPPALSSVEILEEADAVQHRDFLLERESDPCAGSIWRINGLGWDDITERPVLRSTEVWRFVNPTNSVHPMHMHLVFFQVLDRTPMELIDGVPTPTGPAQGPEPTELGWKDTVRVMPGEMVRVIARFDDYTGLFAYHCHILEHEDHEMMRQFDVVECVADLAEPYGVLDFSDVVAFLTAFGSMSAEADLAEPFGQLDSSDVVAFLGSFGAGCP